MAAEVVVELKRTNGKVERHPVRLDSMRFSVRRSCVFLVSFWSEQQQFINQQLVAVSDNVAQLTRVAELTLWRNAFTEFPAGVLLMTQLTYLSLSHNHLVSVPREVGRLTSLRKLYVRAIVACFSLTDSQAAVQESTRHCAARDWPAVGADRVVGEKETGRASLS